MATAGFGWLTQIASSRGYWTVVFGGATLVSLGIGLVYTALASAGTVGVDSTDAGLASGVLNTSRQVGGSIGLAALATVASSHTTHLQHAGIPDTSAIAAGYGRAFAVSCALMVGAFVAAFVVPAVAKTSAEAAAPSGSADDEPRRSGALPE